MAFFPSAVLTFRTIANLPGIVYDAAKATHFYVEDLQALVDEIIAVENTLGENPQGAYDTVDERIAAVEAAEGGGGLDSSRFIFNQKPMETPDGVITVFTLPEAWVSGKLAVHADGLRLCPTDDYTADEGAHTVACLRAPSVIILFDYLKP